LETREGASLDDTVVGFLSLYATENRLEFLNICSVLVEEDVLQ
jgi:hypothetical protein